MVWLGRSMDSMKELFLLKQYVRDVAKNPMEDIMKTQMYRFVFFLMAVLLVWGSASISAAPIEFKQTVTKILHENQFRGWPANAEDSARRFIDLSTSLDGSRVAFTIQGITFNQTRIFSARADGSGIIALPPPYFDDADTVRPGYPVLDPQGQRLFFLMAHNVYHCTIANMACSNAILPKPGEEKALSSYYDSNRPFMPAFLGDQTYFYFTHLEGRFDGRYHWGIYMAPLGGSVVRAMDLDQLPGDTQTWGRLGGLVLLGSAALGDEVIFRWDQGGQTYGMYRMHGPTRVPDELHDNIGILDKRSQISADGSRAMYGHQTESV